MSGEGNWKMSNVFYCLPLSGLYSNGLSRVVHPIFSAILLLYCSTDGSAKGSAMAIGQALLMGGQLRRK